MSLLKHEFWTVYWHIFLKRVLDIFNKLKLSCSHVHPTSCKVIICEMKNLSDSMPGHIISNLRFTNLLLETEVHKSHICCQARPQKLAELWRQNSSWLCPGGVIVSKLGNIRSSKTGFTCQQCRLIWKLKATKTMKWRMNFKVSQKRFKIVSCWHKR